MKKQDFNKLKKWEGEEYSKIRSDLGLILEGQKINQKDLRLGLIGLARQNSELLELNKKLSQQLERVEKEFNLLKKERQEKAARKEARVNRKRLAKRQPITPEIYRLLIQATESPSYTSVRLRIAFCLLTVTGIRINELLPLKVGQLQTLLESGWIEIDRSKRETSNHKAFLTREGKKLVEERKKDFDFLFLMKNLDSYVFTSESNHAQMLSRETITRDVNRVMRSVSKSLPDQPNITSHSFRVGYISQLWKDTKDIEFVKQSIGHRRINITSSYVEKLSDQERHKRSNQLEEI
uniref:Putative integrase/recombinase protein n=1 Tax=Halamphora calidilacuna TaxID=2133758 RepID=A0A516ZBI7_9STRA|nr:putative integrase/recombinase protein [Halamphora calidilacuna]QDR25077.1 putative integrase/recombinase protein [Halamphora calidilacuna]